MVWASRTSWAAWGYLKNEDNQVSSAARREAGMVETATGADKSDGEDGSQLLVAGND